MCCINSILECDAHMNVYQKVHKYVALQLSYL
jgi:hypothetical protein